MRRYDRSREKENEAHQEEERGRHGKERARDGRTKGKRTDKDPIGTCIRKPTNANYYQTD